MSALQHTESLHLMPRRLKILPFTPPGLYLRPLWFSLPPPLAGVTFRLRRHQPFPLQTLGLDLSQSLRIGTPCTSERVRPEPSPAWLWGLQWKIVHLMPADRYIHQRSWDPACPLSCCLFSIQEWDAETTHLLETGRREMKSFIITAVRTLYCF